MPPYMVNGLGIFATLEEALAAIEADKKGASAPEPAAKKPAEKPQKKESK